MFKITSCVESKKIKVTISKDEDEISEYIFYSKRNGTRVGERLVYMTLLRYAILDCIGMDTISLDKPISRVELCYLQGQINNFLEYSKSYNNLKLDGPKIIYPKILKDKFEKFNLDTKSCFIGFSGGKDSTLCLSFLAEKFKNITKFKIDFDDEEFDNDYYETFRILQSNEYEKISSKSIYVKGHLKMLVLGH